MRRVLRLTAGLALAFSLCRPLPALAQRSLSDTPPDNRNFYEAAQEAVAEGILDGYPDGTFRGRRAMTRREFVLALWRTVTRIEQKLSRIRPAGASSPILASPSEAGLFADVPTDSSLGDWLRDLGSRGITQGDPGRTFAASRPMTQGECEIALQRTLQWVERELAANRSASAGAPSTQPGPPPRTPRADFPSQLRSFSSRKEPK